MLTVVESMLRNMDGEISINLSNDVSPPCQFSGVFFFFLFKTKKKKKNYYYYYYVYDEGPHSTELDEHSNNAEKRSCREVPFISFLEATRFLAMALLIRSHCIN